MSRSIRKETSSLAFGIVGRFGGSSAGFVVAALNAASAASREVAVLRVLSAGIIMSSLGLHFIKRKLGGQSGWRLCTTISVRGSREKVTREEQAENDRSVVCQPVGAGARR